MAGAVSGDLARLRAGLGRWPADAAQAAAAAYVAAERRAAAKVAPSGRLRGLPHAGPLAVTTRPARGVTAGAVGVQVVPVGPWWAVEFRRRAGYPIPRRGRRAKKLHLADGRFAVHVTGGGIAHPRRPWHAGAAAGRQPAIVAVRASFDAVLARSLTGGGGRV